MEKSKQNSQKTKVYFTAEKDVWLLKECIAQNPFQLGKEKWKDVSQNLKEQYLFDISERTARERVNTLLAKLAKDELTCRSGSEEVNTERKTLLYDIMDLREETISLLEVIESEKAKDSKAQYVEANQLRDEAVAKYGKDSPVGPTLIRRKRNAVLSPEEEIIMKKQQAEIELEEKKLTLQHEEKLKELDLQMEREKNEAVYKLKSLEVENKRLEIEAKNKETMNTLLLAITELTKSARKD